MARIKFVQRWVDKRDGGASRALTSGAVASKLCRSPGMPGSPEFMEAYQAALHRTRYRR